MTKPTRSDDLFILAAIKDALDLLADQYPTMTLEQAKETHFKLIYAAALAYSPEKLIAQAAAEALASPAVQETLPPW